MYINKVHIHVPYHKYICLYFIYKVHICVLYPWLSREWEVRWWVPFLCLLTRVYIYINMYIYIYMSMFIYTYVYVYTYIVPYVYMYFIPKSQVSARWDDESVFGVSWRVCIYIYTYPCLCTRVHTHTRAIIGLFCKRAL